MDHNLDLLRHHIHKNTQQFLELQMDFKTFPCIMKPTRLTTNTVTLIDNILMSLDLCDRQKSCVVINNISDHLPCFSIVSDCMPSTDETPKILKRSINERNLNRIKSNLGNTNWDTIVDPYKLDDIDKSMQQLTSCIISKLDKVTLNSWYLFQPNGPVQKDG